MATTFTVRVELHGVTGEGGVYDELHGVMFDHDYLRTWMDQKGKLWLLPHAEYVGATTDRVEQLVALVRGWVSAETNHAGGVGVAITEWGRFDAGGLKPAPIYHRQAGSIPGHAHCQAKATVNNRVLKDRKSAEADRRVKGGALCPACFPRP